MGAGTHTPFTFFFERPPKELLRAEISERHSSKRYEHGTSGRLQSVFELLILRESASHHIHYKNTARMRGLERLGDSADPVTGPVKVGAAVNEDALPRLSSTCSFNMEVAERSRSSPGGGSPATTRTRLSAGNFLLISLTAAKNSA